MCDYSLHSVRTRPAKVGDKLVTKDFGTGTRGFASLDDLGTAVCVLPGTELAFASEVSYSDWGIRSFLKGMEIRTQHRTAIFRQINKQKERRITTRWSSPTGRLCCSLAYTKPRGQLSCSFQPNRVLLRKRRNKIKLRWSRK
jgi:hypothetical protein